MDRVFGFGENYDPHRFEGAADVGPVRRCERCETDRTTRLDHSARALRCSACRAIVERFDD